MTRPTTPATPTVLIPGRFCTPLCFEAQTTALWAFGPVTVADHQRDDSIAAIARRILADAPPTFALAGLSMGGYVALEILRQAPQRVTKLALISTSARPDTPEQTERRRQQIDLATRGKLGEIAKLSIAQMFHPKHHGDEALRAAILTMAEQTGADAFVRQQTAIIGRIDSRPHLAQIACPTLVVSAQNDEVIPAAWSQELVTSIPGAQAVEIPECGHLSTLEHPQAVAQALVGFWSR